MCQSGVFVLQESDHRIDRLDILMPETMDTKYVGRCISEMVICGCKKIAQSIPRKQLQDGLNPQVHLVTGDALCIEKPFQVGRRRVGGI